MFQRRSIFYPPLSWPPAPWNEMLSKGILQESKSCFIMSALVTMDQGALYLPPCFISLCQARKIPVRAVFEIEAPTGLFLLLLKVVLVVLKVYNIFGIPLIKLLHDDCFNRDVSKSCQRHARIPFRLFHRSFLDNIAGNISSFPDCNTSKAAFPKWPDREPGMIGVP